MKTRAALLALCLLFAPTLAGAQSDAWVLRRLPWYILPSRELVGSAAPLSLETPGAPGECGALSDKLEPFAARGPVVLKITLKVDSGAVTVSVRGAGETLLSKQKTVAEGEAATVYVRVEPRSGNQAIALCNPGQAGVGGRAEIISVEAAMAEGLPADEAAKVNLGTL